MPQLPYPIKRELQQETKPVQWQVFHRKIFNTLKDNLNAARDTVQDNDPAGAVSELGSARTELNILMTRVGGEDSPGGQQLIAVRNHIDAAEDAAGNADTLKAFQGINAADTELLKITQIIPADEE